MENEKRKKAIGEDGLGRCLAFESGKRLKGVLLF